MGMDVFGISPSTEEGKYFRRNVWGWRPLAALIEEAEPELASRCKSWHTNDGYGLPPSYSERLADALQARVASGWVAAWCEYRDRRVEAMPPRECWICHGTGVRLDAVGQMQQMESKVVPAATPDDMEGLNPRAGQTGWCNGCDGRGYNRPMDANYHVEPNDVVEFIAFLRGCGGFRIC